MKIGGECTSQSHDNVYKVVVPIMSTRIPHQPWVVSTYRFPLVSGLPTTVFGFMCLWFLICVHMEKTGETGIG